MNTAVKEAPTAFAVEVSASEQINAIAASFSARGLSRAVHTECEAQETREAQTRADEPLCYRLTDGSVAYYRHGKDTMSSDDLLTYIKDTRAMRTRNADFSSRIPDDDAVMAGEGEKALCVAVRHEEEPCVKEKLMAIPARAMELPRRAIETVRTSHHTWFNLEKADTTAESRRFPLSALAAIITVAISLMLIVAGSVMITAGEREVDALALEVEALNEDLNELDSDINVNTNLLRIRGFAVSELGMVSEDYLKMEYLSVEKGEAIEVYEEEAESRVSLSTLLSAIGIKFK